MTVRSERLGVRTSAAANAIHVVYTAPAGKTGIVKHIAASYVSGNVTRAVIFLSSGGVTVTLFEGSLDPTSQLLLDCWCVLAPGDSLSVYSEGGVIAIWASGAELIGVSP